jgi:hypothetical protein
MTVDASSCAGTSRSEPPNPPTGVRNGSQMTASRTVLLLVLSARTERAESGVESAPAR